MMKTRLASFLILTSAFTLDAHAGSATWKSNPQNTKWNIAGNWTPGTVPNGPSDIATFAVSNKPGVSITDDTEINEIVFNPGASAFSITSSSDRQGLADLTISGTGVTNNSGIAQNFVAMNSFAIAFTNSATAGDNTIYTATSNPVGNGGVIQFSDDARTGSATFMLQPGLNGHSSGEVLFTGNSTAENATFISTGPGFGGDVDFLDNATPANAIFTNDSGIGILQFTTAANAVVQGAWNIGLLDAANAGFNLTAGSVIFIAGAGATAGNATFILGGSTTDSEYGASVQFNNAGTAGDGTFTLAGGTGGTSDGRTGAAAFFFDTSSGGNATFMANGGTVAGAGGALVLFSSDGAGKLNCTAANSTLIANGGVNGGTGATIQFQDNSLGGVARVEVFANGSLDISDRDTFSVVTIGSLEGDGLVFLGANTLRIGANNLDTVFSGTAQDEGGLGGGGHGSLTKSGTGTLSLSGSNTYTGNTALLTGALLVNNTTGSGTGTGPLTVSGGTLGGKGTISGSVAVGTGSGATVFLAPAFGTNKQVTLTLESSVTLQGNATYTYTFKARNSQSRTDLVKANGVTINGATITLEGKTHGTLTPGTVLTVISNTNANPISGTFSNLADGAIVNVNGNNFQANYEGGDGNDLTLTVVP